MNWTIFTCGEAANPLCLTEEAIQLAHVENRRLRPALLIDDRLDFFPERLYVFRTGIYREKSA